MRLRLSIALVIFLSVCALAVPPQDDKTAPKRVAKELPVTVEKEEVVYNDSLNVYFIGSKIGDSYLNTPMMMTPEEYRQWSEKKALGEFFKKKNAEEFESKGKEKFDFSDMHFDLGPAEKIFGPGGVRVKTQGTAELKLGVNKKERELFLLLITVSGVGPNTARMVLSSLSPSELCNSISTGNERMIKGVKGIGLKTAQRIIVDLKDKIVALGIAEEIPVGGSVQAPVNNQVKDEAVSALTMLGFAPAPSQKVVVAILQQQPDAPVEEVVKLALKQIK